MSFLYQNKLILTIGNIGCGKTTYIKKYALTHILLSKDSIRYMLGCNNYVFDYEFEPYIGEAIDSLYLGLLYTGVNIVIDESKELASIAFEIIFTKTCKMLVSSTTIGDIDFSNLSENAIFFWFDIPLVIFIAFSIILFKSAAS